VNGRGLIWRGKSPSTAGRLEAGTPIAGDARRARRADHPYVSRGGVKLAGALGAFGIEISGRRALDIGATEASDVLLQRGAASASRSTSTTASSIGVSAPIRGCSFARA
jgi:23S rRNA (cytidine1920-2'-O)/16S rRNA (cytidine1409-2'-O)-methyltransferase